ncbi:hypothetical protein BH11PSE11_BH11PSE11_17760 [soil metagenome]
MFILSLIPLTLALLLYAALAKGAARLFRRTQISWGLCAVCALVLLPFSVMLRVALFALDIRPSLVVAIIFAAILHVAFGSWFFSSYAKTVNGELLNPIAAAMLGAIIFCLSALLFSAMWMVIAKMSESFV